MNKAQADSISSYMRTLAPVLTRDLRSDARAAGWPKKVCNSLSVVIDGTTISAAYPTQFTSEVEDLEYGSKSQRPNPVIRTFIAKHSELITKAIAEWSINYMSDEGVFS
jgi:hypothetical protein